MSGVLLEVGCRIIRCGKMTDLNRPRYPRNSSRIPNAGIFDCFPEKSRVLNPGIFFKPFPVQDCNSSDFSIQWDIFEIFIP